MNDVFKKLKEDIYFKFNLFTKKIHKDYLIIKVSDGIRNIYFMGDIYRDRIRIIKDINYSEINNSFFMNLIEKYEKNGYDWYEIIKNDKQSIGIEYLPSINIGKIDTNKGKSIIMKKLEKLSHSFVPN